MLFFNSILYLAKKRKPTMGVKNIPIRITLKEFWGSFSAWKIKIAINKA